MTPEQKAKFLVHLTPETRNLRCHACRDGECGWVECPQLRDNESAATGRHCPYDHWCYYCGEDELDDSCCC